MSPHPLELGISTTLLPFLKPGENGLDDVTVVDGFARGCLPSIAPPILVPFGYALDRVLTVAADDDFHINGGDVNCALDGT